MMTTIEFFQPLSAEKPRAKAARKIITQEKFEEAMGIVFITVSFFVTGWFYYTLYQALHDYPTF
jgi:hypothetical protein